MMQILRYLSLVAVVCALVITSEFAYAQEDSAAQEDSDLFSKEQPALVAPNVAPFGADTPAAEAPNADAVPEAEAEEPQEPISEILPYAHLAIIDKRNATREVVTVKSNSSVVYGHMELTLQRCVRYQSPHVLEHAALVQLSEPRRAKQPLFFYGWLFQVQKALSHPEHPLYDVVLLECRAKVKQATKVKKQDKKKSEDQPKDTEEALD